MRFRETQNQMSVQNPVRPKGETGNLNSTERENASLMIARMLFLYACLGFYLGMAVWILREVSFGWGIWQ
jgi:hypothetical protein